MMNAETLNQYIDEAKPLDAASLRELMALIQEYPYFQPARMLYLKNLSELRSVRYASELRRNAVYMPDRKQLFSCLDNGEYPWSALMHRARVGEGKPDNAAANAFVLIDNYLQHAGENPYPEELEDLFPNIHEEAPADYVHMLLDKPDAGALPANDRQQALIDSFIEMDEKERVIIPLEESAFEPIKTNGKEDALIKDDSFLTESLAKIYIKQKKYSKALEIIKKLSLKYPEKNVYFADQIRFLEKIITNIKSE